ncbi:MAG: saccharopine dehydrogenase NADP-binding domain-containing protein [Hymenobacter sp.]|nr:saccharopine dehydrogenase NADP-binding domain-containing protein [Hymenobacter sp.]
MSPVTCRLLLLGAGRSASSLIQYLLRHAAPENWFLTVADVNPAHLVPVLAAHTEHARAVPFDSQDEARLAELVAGADIVVSMLPALLHGAVARACVRHGRHLATASYVSEEIGALSEAARAAGITMLMECGLDPGLDHMSALAGIRARGGRLTSFRSYCGGLLAPASEGDNPWRYKFTWNPRNVVLAGQGTAKYLENGRPRFLPYQHLFARPETIDVPGYGAFEGYANRDSLSYRAPYGLHDIPTMLRGTLRRPGYCAAWHALIRLGLTDDAVRLGNAADLSWHALLEAYLPVLVPRAATETALAMHCADYLGLPFTGPEMRRLQWLGLFSEEAVGLPDATPAQLLERLLTTKWQLQPTDHDMIVMQHRFGFELGGQRHQLISSLVVLGDDATHTGMAKTVGLPLGMAVRRLARGEVTQRGVVIPVEAELYAPILAELAAEYGIRFVEEETAL